jgi:hypothetical protein
VSFFQKPNKTISSQSRTKSGLRKRACLANVFTGRDLTNVKAASDWGSNVKKY